MKRFNIRVYGIWVNERDEVLLSDEQYSNRSFTKFPGGGLEFGEGLTDCLKREFLEELNMEIEVGELFYLTDFFQQSAFSENDQIVSVYYRISGNLTLADYLISQPIGTQRIHWKKRTELSRTDVTFPIDQLVCEKLRLL